MGSFGAPLFSLHSSRCIPCFHLQTGKKPLRKELVLSFGFCPFFCISGSPRGRVLGGIHTRVLSSQSGVILLCAIPVAQGMTWKKKEEKTLTKSQSDLNLWDLRSSTNPSVGGSKLHNPALNLDFIFTQIKKKSCKYWTKNSTWKCRLTPRSKT